MLNVFLYERDLFKNKIGRKTYNIDTQMWSSHPT